MKNNNQTQEHSSSEILSETPIKQNVPESFKSKIDEVEKELNDESKGIQDFKISKAKLQTLKESQQLANKQLDEFAEKIRMFGRGRYSPRIQNDLNKEIDKLLKESKE